jgi:hypothetical protein
MDETEWLSCNNPHRLLSCLNYKRHDRKLRLFALAFCRRGWHHLQEGWRRAVESGEFLADGLATPEEFERAWEAAYTADPSTASWEPPNAVNVARMVACNATTPVPLRSGTITSMGWEAARYVVLASGGSEARVFQGSDLTNLIRDLFGNPFRPITLSPAWRTPTVLALAQAAYDRRILPAGTLEPERLGVLADSLEDVGCADAEILGHLRGDGTHWRGCWAVDLLLGKE